jgi:hypothetical protein
MADKFMRRGNKMESTATRMTYHHTLMTPKQWKAGQVGEGETGKPFYFDCCECGAKEPVIYGFKSGSETPDFFKILVVEKFPGFHLAMYCQACWEKVNGK